MKVLLLGPYFSNSTHGAEVGIYKGLVENQHDVCVYDYRVSKGFCQGYFDDIIFDFNKLSFDPDMVLCPGPGIPEKIYNTQLWKSFKCPKVIWSSEPIRLKNYRDRMKQQRDLFDFFFTFDESEISLYKQLGISARWLPQAYNPEWYKPLGQKDDGFFTFVGSVGGKWHNRQKFLARVASSFPLKIQTVFSAVKVNEIYNESLGVLNLGLYHEELGPPENIRSYGLQQRIFEAIGAGKVPITHEVETSLFPPDTVIFYNKDNLEERIQYMLNHKADLERNILDIRDEHTYTKRLEVLNEI